MAIVFDVRSLEESEGGIPDYTRSLVAALCSKNTDDTFVMFTNSFRTSSMCNAINFGIPNKLLNASFSLRGKPYLDKKIEERTGKKVDLVFMPNMNFIALSPSAKLVLTVHDLSYERYPQFLSFRSRQWHAFVKPKKLFHSAHRIIAVSEYTKQDLIKTYGIQEDKIRVVHHGIDPYFFSLPKESREQLKIPKRYFLAVGMEKKKKNLPFLLAGYKEFQKDSAFHETPLLITGVHPHRPKNTGSILYLGYPSNKEYHALLSYAEALIYPSLFEGFGLPIVEAFACGTPVIASSHSSISEIGANALYPIDPFNISSLTKAMRDILMLPNLRRDLIEEGRKRASFFSWEECARKTRGVFEEVLSTNI